MQSEGLNLLILFFKIIFYFLEKKTHFKIKKEIIFYLKNQVHVTF